MRTHRGGNRGRAPAPANTPIAHICATASGQSVATAFGRLGPINNATDLLYNAATNDTPAFVAAEQLVHLLDGWKYVSAAFNAYLTNSRSAGTHFAYYAELRAALSLFAGSGIRVNQSDSYFLDSGGTKHQIVGDTRTHSITWKIWQNWIKRLDAIELLTKHVRLITGVTLGDFAGAGNVLSFVLQNWGYDLFYLARDHRARNTASYEPAVNTPLRGMEDPEAALIKRIWTLLLPTEHGVGFDTAFINFLVSKTSLAKNQVDQSKTSDEHMSAMIEAASRQTGVEESIIRSLLVDSQPDIELFEKAAERSEQVENVLCRALFLLRMATLSVARSMTMGAPHSAANWLRNWLATGGLYEERDVEPRDLSEDYRIASEEYYQASSSLPHCLWSPREQNLSATVQLARPDVFVAWAIEL